ncbi:hypothetical protein Tsubulata_000775 [Turnera subulata]|uniref:Bifunctional inhibitor/plant lipid transfer protein/seed storage helical domain-containing protein n=1 Tax=Turnera subulata TaxID=218843 RepID=A0A9Q0JKH5_9ROSI|nr:hypothetical protein Tsubulata_000775 [Turnera subulata]
MARTTNALALAMLIIAGVLLVSGQHVSGKSCNTNINVSDLITKCEKYVGKQGPPAKPSHDCCVVVRKANVPCLCSLVTKDIENFISMEKVAYVTKSCGKKIPPGTKCGSM